MKIKLKLIPKIIHWSECIYHSPSSLNAEISSSNCFLNPLSWSYSAISNLYSLAKVSVGAYESSSPNSSSSSSYYFPSYLSGSELYSISPTSSSTTSLIAGWAAGTSSSTLLSKRPFENVEPTLETASDLLDAASYWILYWPSVKNLANSLLDNDRLLPIDIFDLTSLGVGPPNLPPNLP